MLTMAAGILSFFLLEKAVIWRHCHHDEDCHVHSTAASLVIVGDAFHTFVDGAVIAAAVLTSVPLGLTTALAVATHEIPQEVGDVAILLRAGYSRLRAFTLNVLAGVGGILGAAAMVLASKIVPQALPYVLAFAAGNFLYVAMSDLIPDLHRGNSVGGLRQVLLIGAGIVTIAAPVVVVPLHGHDRRLPLLAGLLVLTVASGFAGLRRTSPPRGGQPPHPAQGPRDRVRPRDGRAKGAAGSSRAGIRRETAPRRRRKAPVDHQDACSRRIRDAR